MATAYWLGTETSHTGDLNRAANWSPSGVPGAGDDLVFDGRSTEDVDTNLDTFEGTDIGSLTVWSGYTGTIGTSGSAPLITECSAGTVYLAGTGTTRLQCGAGANVDASILKTVINTSGSVWLSSQANDNTNVAKFTEIQVLKGNVLIMGDSEASTHGGDSGTAITTLKVIPSSTATVRIGDMCVNYQSTDTPMNITVSGGTLTTHTALGTVQQFGGTLNYGSTDFDMTGTDDDITALALNGGTFYWKPQSSGSISESSVITTLDVISGTFNGTSMKETNPGGVDPVVTTTWQYGGTVDLRNIYANFDFTTYYQESGSLYYSPGQQLTLEGGA